MCHGRRLQKSLRMVGDSSTLSVRDMRRHLRLSVIFPPSFGIRPTAAQMTLDKASDCRSIAAVRSVYVYMIHPLFSHFNPFFNKICPSFRDVCRIGRIRTGSRAADFRPRRVIRLADAAGLSFGDAPTKLRGALKARSHSRIRAVSLCDGRA